MGNHILKVGLIPGLQTMKVEKSGQPLLTINTHPGFYLYSRLHFGNSTVSALWQESNTPSTLGYHTWDCILY